MTTKEPPVTYENPEALAAAETYLIHVLESSTPAGDPAHYDITEAVEAHRAATGSYDIEAAGADAARELLSRYKK